MIARRAVVAGLGAGFLTMPRVARGQTPGKVYRIGFLRMGAEDFAYEAFRQGLRDLGYVEGQTVALEARFAGDETDRLPALAAEPLRLKVDVIE